MRAKRKEIEERTFRRLLNIKYPYALDYTPEAKNRVHEADHGRPIKECVICGRTKGSA